MMEALLIQLPKTRTGNDRIGSGPSGGSDFCISKYRHPVVLISHYLDTARSGELKSKEFQKIKYIPKV